VKEKSFEKTKENIFKSENVDVIPSSVQAKNVMQMQSDLVQKSCVRASQRAKEGKSAANLNQVRCS
jgi:hypothetical protein